MSNVRVVPAEVEAESEALATESTVPGSLLDSLRQSAQATQRERLHDMEVPGWKGQLVLRFRPMDVGQLERYVERRNSNQNARAQIAESIDALTICCVGVFGRDDDRLIELRDENTGHLLRIEHGLAELLGWPSPPDGRYTGREVALKLFGGNAFALGEFVDSLITWMRDPDAFTPPGES
jgi:hypothetical protein